MLVPTNVQTKNPTARPEFYDPKAAMAKVESALNQDSYFERTKNQKVHGYDPEQYLLLWEMRFQKHEKSMRKLWEMMTTMHRRFRGVTISDQFGYFGTMPTTEGRWVDYQPDLDGEVHPINIVRPDIRANVCALLQVEVGVQITSPNQDARFHEIAQQLQLLADFLRRDMWTEAERTLLFDGIQKEGTILNEIFIDRENARAQAVTLPTKLQQHYAILRCQQCGVEGAKEISPEQAEQHHGLNVNCPECDTPNDIEVKTLTNYDVDQSEIKTSEIGHKLHSGFNFLIDRQGAKRKGIQSAKYMRTMELVERCELEDTYPQFQFDSPYEWSFGLKCEQALASANWDMLYSAWMPSQHSPEWDLFQKNTNYLHESSYKNYISPTDWEFRGREGKLKFSIKRGQSWKDAVKNSMGSECQGYRYVFVNEHLIDIETPPDFEPNFRKCFTDCHFQRDSGSYHSIPHWDSVQLQDDITLFNTIKVETAARNSVEPVWFDSTIFDIHDFSRDYIPSKDGALDKETKIGDKVYKPPIAKSAEQLTEHLLFLMGVRREVSGVQPALLGESQPGQPYAAQRQQLDQAFGLLTSAAKSNAQMEVESTKQALMFCFEHYTIEQFQDVASRFGEHWDEQTVKALINTDLNRDVEVAYVEGTDQPQGRLAKELKFFQGLREIMPFVEAGIVPAPIMTQILKRVDDFAGFDFDLSGAETTDALAQKRFRKLSEVCAEFKPLTRDDIDEYKQTVVAYQPAPAQLPAAPAGMQMSDGNDSETAETPDGDESGGPQSAPSSQNTPPPQAANTGVQRAGGAEIPTPPQITPPQPITAWDMMSEEIIAAADIYISPVEDVAAQAAFFLPMVTLELARPQPNYVLVDMLEWLLDQFQQRIPPPQDPEAQAKMVETMGYKDVPEDIKRQFEAKGGFTPSTLEPKPPITDVVAAHKTMLDAKKLEVEQQRTDADREHTIDHKVLDEASKENDRDFRREEMAHEIAMHEGDKAHESVESEKDRKAKAAEIKAKPKAKPVGGKKK